MGLDRDMVAAAATEASRASPVPSAKTLERWIATLGEREKVALLSRVAAGETGVGADERLGAVARERDLARLAKRQAEAWRRVETLVVTKRPADYDAAVTLLRDLREIGERAGRGAETVKRIRALRESHAKKPSLLARLRKAGL